MRYGFVKILIEDIPIMVIQSLFLHLDQCKEGLSTVIILSLYFNGICILYAFSNIFTLTGNSKNQSKIYQKELERLKDFYDQSNNQIRVVAEFYIEDNLEFQATKL
jgi:ABC-type multidrug transport system fused ATPase/permease subunit